MTHPFHPLYGRTFELLTRGQAWGVDRVAYRDGQGRWHSMPANWTDASAPAPFVAIAAGRAYLRPDDLLRLVDLVEQVAARNETSAVGKVSTKFCRDRKMKNAAKGLRIRLLRGPGTTETAQKNRKLSMKVSIRRTRR